MRPSRVVAALLLFHTVSIGVGVGLGIRAGDPMWHFGEYRLLTWSSALQLLAMAWIALRTQRRMPAASTRGLTAWRSPRAPWTLATLGFLFLAADELMGVHERTDRAIHWGLGIDETALTDRIDDLLVGLYCALGAVFFYAYRESLRLDARSLPFLAFGFALALMMVMLDVLTNRSDILRSWIPEPQTRSAVHVSLRIAEDSLKLYAEAVFAVGLLVAGQIATAKGHMERGQIPKSAPRTG